MKNILTIDLEDWHSLSCRGITGHLPPISPNLFFQTDRLLGLLEQYQTKATFFILGIVAKQHPSLIKKIADQGHEIASHGFNHKLIYSQSPKEFSEDVKNSKHLLEDIIGQPVIGYRAPIFSIIKQTLWALDILAENGFLYDSSIFPIWHRRYGIPNFMREPARYKLPHGGKIMEAPLTTFSCKHFNLPVAGGGYFRLLPFPLILQCLQAIIAENLPIILYFHPYEFQDQDLNCFYFFKPKDLKERLRGWRGNLQQNIGRYATYNKLERLLRLYQFTRMDIYFQEKEFIQECKLEKN